MPCIDLEKSWKRGLKATLSDQFLILDKDDFIEASKSVRWYYTLPITVKEMITTGKDCLWKEVQENSLQNQIQLQSN